MASIAPGDPKVAEPIVEALRSLRGEEDFYWGDVRIHMNLALIRLEPNSDQSMDRVGDLIAELEEHASEPYRINEFKAMAEAMVDAGAHHREFRSVLQSLIHDKPLLHAQYRCIAAGALLRLDAINGAALTYLQRAARHNDHFIQEAAREELQQTASGRARALR